MVLGIPVIFAQPKIMTIGNPGFHGQSRARSTYPLAIWWTRGPRVMSDRAKAALQAAAQRKAAVLAREPKPERTVDACGRHPLQIYLNILIKLVSNFKQAIGSTKRCQKDHIFSK